MRDYSHGKVRQEKTKDIESFKLRLSYRLTNMTGMALESWDFTDAQIRAVMGFDSVTAAEILIAGTDYNSDKANHG